MNIHRRGFLGSSLALGAAATVTLPARAAPTAATARLFEVTTTVDLGNTPEAARLWLPVFQSDANYQKRLARDWQGNAHVRLARDAASGGRYIAAHWAQSDNAGQPSRRQLTLTQRVATWERTDEDASHAHLSAADHALWTAAAPNMPTDGIVRTTAQAIVGDIREPRLQVRALYDWVVAHSWRNPATPGCGTGDVAVMLTSGNLGGKCADISSLMVALCRAIGIPARDVYGIRLAPSSLFKALGRGGGDITNAQHCRAEVWLDGAGWFAVDPADVRKAVLEEKLTVDSAPIKALAERLFGAWESNWAGYNSASALAMPGTTPASTFHFLMYPAALRGTTPCNCLEAKSFAYRMTSTEVTV